MAYQFVNRAGFASQMAQKLALLRVSRNRLAHLLLLAQLGKVQMLQHIINREQRRSTLADKLVAAHTARVQNTARHSKNLAPLLGSKVSSDQSTTFLARLHDDHGAAQPADNAVAWRKIFGLWPCPQGIFADQRTLVAECLTQLAVAGRVNLIDSAAQHGQCAPASI